MLNAISWNQFFTSIAIALLAYYTFVLLVYYRQELLAIIRGKYALLPVGTKNSPATHASPLMGPAWPEAFTNPEKAESGPVFPETAPAYETLAAEEVTIATPSPATAEVLQLGTVADLLEEIKALLHIITEHQGEKAEALPLFGALFARYPQLAGTPYQEAITLYLYEAWQSQQTFQVSFTELNHLWTQD